MANEHNPKVFISYSQDSVAFADRVLDLSNRLRMEGIDTILDQYEESPPEGWPRWMERSIDDADYIVVVSSAGYKAKLTGQTETGVGKGVKWEGKLIYQKLYMSDSLNHKFIPVIFEENDIQFIPTPIQGSTYYNVSIAKCFDDLYWRLRGINMKQKPPLGKLRPLPEKERKTLFIPSIIDVKAWDKATWRGPGFLIPYGNDFPRLLFIFINEKYAKQIFHDWIAAVGKEDRHEAIRIAFVEGNVPNEELGYYVVVGPNVNYELQRAESKGIPADETMLLSLTRIIRANPRDNFALFNRFKKAYQKHHKYSIMPAIVDEKTGSFTPLPEYEIFKASLEYRNIADIQENDQDAILLDPNKPFRPYTGSNK